MLYKYSKENKKDSKGSKKMTYTNINTIVELETEVNLEGFLNRLEKDSLVYELRPLTKDSRAEKLPLSYDEHESMFELAVSEQVILVKLHSDLTADRKSIRSMDIFSTTNNLTDVKEFNDKLFVILTRALNEDFKMVTEFNGVGERESI